MNEETTLTRRQRAVLEHLREMAADGQQPPTLDEMCEALGLRSRGSLHKHVTALVDAGFVMPMAGQQRGVRLTPVAVMAGAASVAGPSRVESLRTTSPDPVTLPPSERGEFDLPLLGAIAAGRPIEAIAGEESVSVPPSLRTGRPCYVLKVRGDSMVEDGILDGDMVVIERRDHAHNGEIVVALVDGEEATLKRILQRPDEVVLCPANSTMEAMRFAPERVSIQGVVVGQMRRYQ